VKQSFILIHLVNSYLAKEHKEDFMLTIKSERSSRKKHNCWVFSLTPYKKFKAQQTLISFFIYLEFCQKARVWYCNKEKQLNSDKCRHIYTHVWSSKFTDFFIFESCALDFVTVYLCLPSRMFPWRSQPRSRARGLKFGL
jgi:hypothetical protein